MTHIATCGHDITYSKSFAVTMKVEVIDFALDRYVDAEETGVYCEACTKEMRADQEYIADEQYTDENGEYVECP